VVTLCSTTGQAPAPLGQNRCSGLYRIAIVTALLVTPPRVNVSVCVPAVMVAGNTMLNWYQKLGAALW
jgi:hypothetical protein